MIAADPGFARYGLAGEVLEQLEPHTEGHPWAILAQFLTMFGNALGRGPHVVVGSEKQPCRLFCVICGPSAIARKGASLSVVEAVMEQADQGWLYDRRKSGLASGEALIEQFATDDDDDNPRPADHRLMLVETEFARVLQVASRPGAIVSAVIRQAWDTGNLSNLTRRNSVSVSGAHVSVVGHITDHELRKELTENDTANGFANRFLYFQVERAKRVAILPPLEPDKAKQLGKLVGDALTEGRTLDRISLGERTVPMWEMVYAMEEEDPNPLLGVLVGRAPAYMLRLAALYAVLDRTSIIEPEHLLAACEIWDYSAASVGRIFGSRTGWTTSDRIADALESAGGEMTRTEISDLFHRHKSKDEIDEALNRLFDLNVIVFGQRQTEGRPADVVRLSDSEVNVEGVPGTMSRGGFLRWALSAAETLSSLVSPNSQFANDDTDDDPSS